MTTRWATLYASDVNFKEFVLSVVEEKEVASVSIGDKRALLSQYEQRQPQDDLSKRPKLKPPPFSPDLGDYDSAKLIELKASIYIRDRYVLADPFVNEAFVKRESETRFMKETILQLIRAPRNDKKSKIIMECATMSGAGKSRLLFNIFQDMDLKTEEGVKMPLHVIRANFNGADGGRDLLGVVGRQTKPIKAACRLLLTRGLLSCSPDASCIGGLDVSDENLPNAEELCKALFQSFFGGHSNGNGVRGIIVVHLDELGVLIKARRQYEEKETAFEWVKQYLYSIVSLSDAASGRMIVPVITHTSPIGHIFEAEDLSRANYVPWKMFPFTTNGLWSIIDQNRKLNNMEPVPDHNKGEWSSCIALTGGHPSLLLDAFPFKREFPGYNAATVHSVIIKLLDNHRVGSLPESVTSQQAQAFLLDVFGTARVDERKHDLILQMGWAWYLPHTLSTGKVSTPFPYLMRLMMRAGGVFADVASQLDPAMKQYEPTKAMEYVAALGFLVKRVGNVGDWIGTDLSVRGGKGQAIRAIRSIEGPFMSVLPAANEAATDFGGKVEVEDAFTAVIGQVKMQSFGKNTTQAFAEVMAVAWFIGKAVRKEPFDIPVRAVFVSSRRAQAADRMRKLKHAFRVAMSGILTESAVREAAGRHYRKEKVTVEEVIEYLQTQPISNEFDFEYVGRTNNESDSNNRIAELSDFLPAGVFAGWE